MGKSLTAPTNAEHRVFRGCASELLDYFERVAWPIRIESLISQGSEEECAEHLMLSLAKAIDAHPSVRTDWLALPAPSKKSEGSSEASLTTLERVRIFGMQKSKAFFVAAYLAHQISPEKLEGKVSLDAPVSTWQGFDKIFGDEATNFETKLECSALCSVFEGWLASGSCKQDAARAKRWFALRMPQWEKLWLKLETEAKANRQLPARAIMKSQILLDIGRATMIAFFESANLLWAKAEKDAEASVLSFRKECERFGFASTQLAALWAQSVGRTSNLATPLRLLLRPWHAKSAHVLQTHAETALFLDAWMSGRIV